LLFCLQAREAPGNPEVIGLYLSRPGRITETPTIIPAMKAINIKIRMVWMPMLTTPHLAGRQRGRIPSILCQPAFL
jgi:hypothetical protein